MDLTLSSRNSRTYVHRTPMSDSEGDARSRVASSTSSATSALYRHLPYDSGQAILFLPASSGEGGLGERREESGDDGEGAALGISGEEARKFYEDVISRPRESEVLKIDNSITSGRKFKKKREHQSGKRVLSASKKLKDGRRPFSQTQLFKFAQEGDVEGLHAALSDGAHDINMRDAFHWTLLMCASHAGHVTVVQYLLDNGAEWRDIVDKRGNTATDLARFSKHIHIAQLIEDSDRKALGRTRERDGEKAGRNRKCRDGVEAFNYPSTFYCDVCKMDISHSQPVSSHRHKTSVTHQFSCQHTPSVSPYIIPETNRGYQLLVRGGWNPRAGLGSQRQGQQFPVKTVLKQDRRGFGEPSGERSQPRVTHFTAYDTDAIKSSRERSGVSETAGVWHKKRDILKAAEKERRWEIRMRRYMNTD